MGLFRFFSTKIHPHDLKTENLESHQYTHPYFLQLAYFVKQVVLMTSLLRVKKDKCSRFSDCILYFIIIPTIRCSSVFSLVSSVFLLQITKTTNE